MNFITAIFDNFLIPPFGFISLALVGLLLCWLSHRHSTAWRLGMSGLGLGLMLTVLSMLPITPSLLKQGLEAGLPAVTLTGPGTDPQIVPGDIVPGDIVPGAIVVLAGDTAGNRVSGGVLPGPQPGPLSMERLRAAVILARRTHLPILITGGNAAQGAIVSDMMRDVMITDYGLPPEQVPLAWLDHNAEDTWENASNAAAILRQAGINAAYVVTNGWHMRRAIIAFRHAGLAIIPAPASFTQPVRPAVSDFMPRAISWLETYYALHEWLGCAYYALRV